MHNIVRSYQPYGHSKVLFQSSNNHREVITTKSASPVKAAKSSLSCIRSRACFFFLGGTLNLLVNSPPYHPAARKSGCKNKLWQGKFKCFVLEIQATGCWQNEKSNCHISFPCLRTGLCHFLLQIPPWSPVLLACASASPHLFQTLTSLCPVSCPWHPPRFLLWLHSLQSIRLTACFCATTCRNFLPFSVLPALWSRNNAFIAVQRTGRAGISAAEQQSTQL